MVFCPIARGACPGQKKCPLWSRGRIQNMDTKLLANRLARFILTHSSRIPENSRNPSKFSQHLTVEFWKTEGLPNVRQVCVTDRYIAEKIRAVENLAAQWLESPAFRASIRASTKHAIKKA